MEGYVKTREVWQLSIMILSHVGLISAIWWPKNEKGWNWWFPTIYHWMLFKLCVCTIVGQVFTNDLITCHVYLISALWWLKNMADICGFWSLSGKKITQSTSNFMCTFIGWVLRIQFWVARIWWLQLCWHFEIYFLKANVCIFICISLKFVPEGPVGNMTILNLKWQRQSLGLEPITGIP